jgi:glycosyltransferase involved in cell wall biosynthesis
MGWKRDDLGLQSQAQRIIFLPFIDAFGGAERLVLDLSRFLHETGIASTIACFRQAIDLRCYADWPLRIHQLRPPRNSVVEARALSRYLRDSRLSTFGRPLLFDLKSAFYSGIVSFGQFALHLTDPPSLLPADLSKHARLARARIPKFQDLPRPGASQFIRAELAHCLNQRGVRRASRVIVMTEKVRAEVQQLYGVESSVIRPGVPAINSSSKSFGTDSKPLRLLSVSRLEPNKRLDRILRALEALQSAGRLKKNEWVFEILGHGSAADSLKRLARQLGLERQVTFLGHVSDVGLAAAYARANLFVMPAVQGYGLPALEALQRELPTIVHRESGVSEILGQSPWVEIIEGNNGSLALAIAKMKDRLATSMLTPANKPHVPTSTEWARQVSETCGWLPKSPAITN